MGSNGVDIVNMYYTEKAVCGVCSTAQSTLNMPWDSHHTYNKMKGMKNSPTKKNVKDPTTTSMYSHIRVEGPCRSIIYSSEITAPPISLKQN